MASRLAKLWKTAFLKNMAGLQHGNLELVCPDDIRHFGDPENPLHAMVMINDEDFFRSAVLAGDIGIGESYVRGQWSTPDLVSVVRLGVRNIDAAHSANSFLGAFHRLVDFLAHRRNSNSVAGSKRNIAYHYDLGNDFYRLFLDKSMAYSCAYYASPDDSLEQAQHQKFDYICRKLRLGPQDHLLEIGTGWGGFAAYAAEHYGCRITTTTISRQQHDYALDLFSRLGAGRKRINLLFEDYRNLRGLYDKIVSIEMFEAVGHAHYDDYFGACDRLLKSGGTMLLQTITIQDGKFKGYSKRSDWIKKYIFPGAELASVTEILRSLARSTQMQVFHLEDIGIHYALTLRAWRQRFHAHFQEVRQQGFDERFLRMWEYYLSYCEAAFLERYISDAQIVLGKLTCGHPLMYERNKAVPDQSHRKPPVDEWLPV